jgi:putative transposase
LAVLTDHGTQFCVNKRDKKGVLNMGLSCTLRGIVLSLFFVGVKYPQTNGKLEKFHDLYNIHRFRFGCLDDFVVWYNGRSYGALDLWEVETPDMAFVRRLWPEVWLGIAAKQFGW